MRIVFVCGSLKPGCDGVGDYTRLLAGELIQQGHQASIVAFNDMHLASELEDFEHTQNLTLPILRLPSIWSSKQRFNRAGKYIRNFSPDLLSLQFVPFSFNSKGLPFGLGKRLELLGGEKEWHIMFHELWVGMERKASFKLMMWGKVQRWLIQSLISNLQPVAVHTQTKLYQSQLAKIGVNAKYLPLFSNIPVKHDYSDHSGTEVFSGSDNSLTLVLFGGIHAGAPVEKFALEVSSYSRDNNIQIHLIIIGRCGIEKDHWAKAWKAVGLNIDLLGEQPTDKISKILGSCTFGISTTPVALAEKSGTVAAMLDHGLPVLCVRNSWEASGFKDLSPPFGVVEYQEGCLKSFFENKDRVVSNITVASVGVKIVEDLLLGRQFGKV